MAKTTKQKPEADKKILTLFLLIVPSLLLAMSAAIEEVIVRIMIQAVILLLQIVLVKNLLDQYYAYTYGN